MGTTRRRCLVLVSYDYIEEAIMGAAQEAIDYAKTTYDKLYTWQPVWTTLRFDGEVWKEVGAPGNATWRWYGNPNDKINSIFSPADGDMWIKTS